MQSERPIRSRADLEIEVARQILRLERRQAHANAKAARNPEIRAWLEGSASQFLRRTSPELRGVYVDRFKEVCELIGNVSIEVVDSKRCVVTLVPYPNSQREPESAPGNAASTEADAASEA